MSAKMLILSLLFILINLQVNAADKKVVKVFILAGQSNMVGHGKVEFGLNPEYYPEKKKGVQREIKGGINGLRYLATNPKTKAKYKHLLTADGKWVERDDVWVYSTAPGKDKGKLTVGFGKGNWFGPEFGFGHIVGDHIKQPVLIIKTAWGGKTLALDFRPPSSGKPSFDTKYESEAIGKYYRDMLSIVKDVTSNLDTHYPELAGHKVEYAGFGWHQGWNDAGSKEMVAEYGKNFTNLVNDLRKEFKTPDMPVVIANTGMIGMGGKGIRNELCEIQLAMAKLDGVSAVDTRPFDRKPEESPSNFGYHWKHNAESHYLVGEAMGKAMVKLLKK